MKEKIQITAFRLTFAVRQKVTDLLCSCKARPLNSFLLDKRKSKNHDPWLSWIMRDARPHEFLDLCLLNRDQFNFSELISFFNSIILKKDSLVL